MKHRNLHPFAQFLFNVKALGRFDVFQVDTAEGWLQRSDDIDQFVRIALIDLNIEYVDPGKFLEQNSLALHDRFRCQRADRTQAEYGGAVGDYADQIAACRQVAGFGRVFHNGFANLGHTRCIGERKIALGRERFGGGNFDLAGDRIAVIFERGRF